MRALVTGANGHVGYNLCEALRRRGWEVHAGIRNMRYAPQLENLGCRVVRIDMLRRHTLDRALRDVDVVFQTAATYRVFVRNALENVLQANIRGTVNIMEAAADAGVDVVYVSSVAALMEGSNPYAVSKKLSEQHAWRIARERGVRMVSVLPSGIVGPKFLRLTPTLEMIRAVLYRRIPLMLEISFDFVDVRDVAVGMILAYQHERWGRRYVLGSGEVLSLRDIFRLAQSVRPEVRMPEITLPRGLIMMLVPLITPFTIAMGMGRPLTSEYVRRYYANEVSFDISRTCEELGYSPGSAREAVLRTMRYLLRWRPV